MHELSIAQSIFETVEIKAAECHARQVKSVHLQIGEASGVVIDALTFCFEMLASLNPVTVGVQLQIDTVPHRALCQHCERVFAIINFVARCPTCGTWSGEVVSGTELRILEMEIEPGEVDVL